MQTDTEHAPSRGAAVRHVLCLVLVSRLWIFAGVLLAVTFGTAYDVSGALGPPRAATMPAATWTATWAEAMHRWDTVYFAGIATRGYRYEQELAFFPGWPVAMRALASAAAAASPLRHVPVLVAGLVLSSAVSAAAAVSLYLLTRDVFHDHARALAAAVLWLFGPSMVVVAGAYTEAAFAACAFLGAYALLHGRRWTATALLAAASALRSNGLLHLPVVVGAHLLTDPRALAQPLGAWPSWRSWRPAPRRILAAAVGAAAVGLPVALHQLPAWWAFCYPSPTRPWCAATPPSVYAFVQSHYWGNGFLRYWTPNNVPNFLLALPHVALTAASVGSAASAAWTAGPGRRAAWRSTTLAELLLTLPWWILVGMLVTAMHVQVILRVVTGSPAFYWTAAGFYVQARRVLAASSAAVASSAPSPSAASRRGSMATTLAAAILPSYVLYGSVGIVLFSLFYPPA
ncbi:hypothetical protein CXG81DRAFT_27806 [Caulochytrium protostelioides]|uniref:GPI mannosyltransferase 2 n=1 Tax=Caulochytrium protostelioides TaxID=1555241 RepID=A0A4P9X347_9FUNG|nr:hypothetical protein CXG81DRAFT_27806 [Caulochytrium protostelioides]|eukprot:RKO99435.1 hypothetical protein CXG81DRAFT_27806 [Caulochytrium protostelioides]